MSDFSSNKPAISSQYPSDATTLVGGGQSGFTRVEPFPTPEKLKGEYLFGIPLFDPRTRQQLPDSAIQSILRRAAVKIETECRIDVWPVQRVVRIEFDRTKYLQGWSELDLGYKNVSSLQEVSIRASNSVSTYNQTPDNPEGSLLYNMPLDWIDMNHAARGLIHFVPLQTTFQGTGLTGGAMTGAYAPLFAVFSKLQWIPSFWFAKFTTGFQENALPLPVSDLICTFAAMEILSMLAALNRNNSQSIGLDGASQGISNAGPQIYNQRLDDMEKKALPLKEAIISRFQGRFHMDYI